MCQEADALASFGVWWWWLTAGPGSPSWRAGLGLAKTEPPVRYLIIPRRP